MAGRLYCTALVPLPILWLVGFLVIVILDSIFLVIFTDFTGCVEFRINPLGFLTCCGDFVCMVPSSGRVLSGCLGCVNNLNGGVCPLGFELGIRLTLANGLVSLRFGFQNAKYIGQDAVTLCMPLFSSWLIHRVCWKSSW